MNRYGVIDFGSNTIRLCIYQTSNTDKSLLSSKDVSTLLNYKEMAGIASYVKDGVLIDKGIKKAANTILEHKERASFFNCKEIHVFATAVLRNCKNSGKAKAAIEEATGLPITILSNEEEAHLGLVGARLTSSIANATVIDIGGGSTELTNVVEANETNRTSIAQGSLSSYSMFVEGLLPTQNEMRLIANHFEKLCSAFPKGAFVSNNLVGIGGSIRSAAKVYGDIFQQGKRSNKLTQKQLTTLLDAYKEEPNAFIHRAVQTIPDRIHTFLPGCVLINEVFKLCNALELTIAKTGVREGFLLEKIL